MLVWAFIGFGSLIVAGLLYFGLFQDRSRGRPRCPRCWYNMTGAPTLVCPECGHDARHQQQLYRTRRRKWALWCAVLAAFCCVYFWQVRTRVVELKEPTAAALRPTTYLLLKLPSASPTDLQCLNGRIERSGVWPWEARLLLLQFDHELAVPPHQVRRGLFNLLTAAAGSSGRILDRLVELRDTSDTDTRYRTWAAVAANAARLRDEQLSAMLDTILKAKTRLFHFPAPQMLLAEMLRRNRPEFREQIARWAAEPPLEPFGAPGTPINLELITALRRMDRQHDPLAILVRGSPTVECTTAALPAVHVTIHNVDVSQVAVGFTWGGDYRSGRQDRWRFVVQGEDGPVLPIMRASGYAGGLSSFMPLKFGESYETDLEMSKYIPPLPPGRYRVLVQYNNSQVIALHDDVSNFINFSSQPFDLIVRVP